MEKVDLLPCPFCGGEPSERKTILDADRAKQPMPWSHYVACNQCGSETRHYEFQQGGELNVSRERAAELWNHRPAPHPSADLLEKAAAFIEIELDFHDEENAVLAKEFARFAAQETAECHAVLEEAVRLGKSQADEFDRFWQAIGMGTAETSVDDCIKLWQSRESELATIREERDGLKTALANLVNAVGGHQSKYSCEDPLMDDAIEKALAALGRDAGREKTTA